MNKYLKIFSNKFGLYCFWGYICITQKENNIMKTFENLKQVFEAADHQVTAQELLNGRLYLKGEGWASISLTPEFRGEIAEDIAMRLGGRQNTKNEVARVLKRTPHTPQHWGLGRFILQNYGDRYFIGYVAGQDQQWEANEIRTYLKNV